MPVEYIELVLCREFHWELASLRQMARSDVHKFLIMLSIEAELRSAQGRVRARAR